MSDIPESLALNLESLLSWLREIVQTAKQPRYVRVRPTEFKYIIDKKKINHPLLPWMLLNCTCLSCVKAGDEEF